MGAGKLNAWEKEEKKSADSGGDRVCSVHPMTNHAKNTQYR